MHVSLPSSICFSCSHPPSLLPFHPVTPHPHPHPPFSHFNHASLSLFQHLFCSFPHCPSAQLQSGGPFSFCVNITITDEGKVLAFPQGGERSHFVYHLLICLCLFLGCLPRSCTDCFLSQGQKYAPRIVVKFSSTVSSW